MVKSEGLVLLIRWGGFSKDQGDFLKVKVKVKIFFDIGGAF